LKAEQELFKKLELNPLVQKANIKELFEFYNLAFFESSLEGTCILE